MSLIINTKPPHPISSSLVKSPGSAPETAAADGDDQHHAADANDWLRYSIDLSWAGGGVGRNKSEVQISKPKIHYRNRTALGWGISDDPAATDETHADEMSWNVLNEWHGTHHKCSESWNEAAGCDDDIFSQYWGRR